MEQPPGYIHPRFPTHVCLLKKDLYGLKQAPRAWSVLAHFFSHLVFLAVTLTHPFLSFITNLTFFYLFFRLMILLLLITTHLLLIALLASFILSLLPRIWVLNYFLGLEASLTPDGLFISQLKYAQDILTRAQFLDGKPVYTSMVVSQHLIADGSPLILLFINLLLTPFSTWPLRAHILSMLSILSVNFSMPLLQYNFLLSYVFFAMSREHSTFVLPIVHPLFLVR